MKDNRHIYLSKRSLIKDDYNAGKLYEKYENLVNQFDIAVVIPVKNEFPTFFQTLDSWKMIIQISSKIIKSF